MQRRNFILTTAIALPAFACSSLKKFEVPSTKGYVVKSGASRFGVPTPFRGVNPNDLKISARDTGGLLSTFEYTGVEKTGPALHRHFYQDEIFYVLEGAYLFQVGQEKQILGAGDVIFLPRNIPHTWVQMSDSGKLFYFLQPAGKMEEFFLKMNALGSKATAEERDKIHVECGIETVGPGISATDQTPTSLSLSNGFITKSGRGRFGETTKINGANPNDLKVSGQDTGDALSIFEYTGKEKGGPPLHVHPHQDEVFYVMQGEYLFQLGQDKHRLKSGDMIFLPRGIPHAFAQLTDEGKMLFFFQPSGKMEDFFRALGKMQGPPAPEQGAKLFEDHDMKIVGPPLQYGE